LSCIFLEVPDCTVPVFEEVTPGIAKNRNLGNGRCTTSLAGYRVGDKLPLLRFVNLLIRLLSFAEKAKGKKVNI